MGIIRAVSPLGVDAVRVVADRAGSLHGLKMKGMGKGVVGEKARAAVAPVAQSIVRFTLGHVVAGGILPEKQELDIRAVRPERAGLARVVPVTVGAINNRGGSEGGNQARHVGVNPGIFDRVKRRTRRGEFADEVEGGKDAINPVQRELTILTVTLEANLILIKRFGNRIAIGVDAADSFQNSTDEWSLSRNGTGTVGIVAIHAFYVSAGLLGGLAILMQAVKTFDRVGKSFLENTLQIE